MAPEPDQEGEMQMRADRRGPAARVLAAGTVLATALALAPAALASVTRTGAVGGGRVALTGSVPGFVRAGRLVGAARPGSAVDFEVLLGMRHAAAAAADARARTTPGSPLYAHWLSDAAFRRAYSPTSGEVGAVSAWLRSEGLNVSSVAASRLYVAVHGTVAAADRAFGTTLRMYAYHGKILRANATELTVPAGLKGIVAGVTDLDDGMALVQPAATALPGPPPAARFGVQPCSAYYGQKIATSKPAAYGRHEPYTVCGYLPSQYRSAYGLQHLENVGLNGRGVTVEITDAYASPTIVKDVNTYSRRHGLPTLRPGQFRQVLPPSFNHIKTCGPQGWYGEETLDVEAVHGMAPGAKIVFVAGSNCLHGLPRAWANSIDHHLAQIITNSWTVTNGEGTEGQALSMGYVKFVNEFALEAALTGIGNYFSSGDDGDDTISVGHRAVDFPASDPWVTGVGGTSVGIGARGQYLWETGWSNSYSTLTKGAWSPKPPGTYNSGAGGGTSKLFGQPFYQKGRVPASISQFFSPRPHRAVPDVAMPADPNTGMLVGETQVFPNGTRYGEYRIGGTSLASPLMAGVMAVADDAAGFAHGFVNPALYQLLGTRAVHDVRPLGHRIAEVRTDYVNSLNNAKGKFWRLRTAGIPTTIFTRPGYDDVTGVGTPNGTAFVRALGRR
jgi:subtilase family serine protease